MSVTIRPYEYAADYNRVGQFLIDVYEPGDVFANWLQPRWEYMHFHPMTDDQPLERMGVVEDRGEVVGVVHFEEKPTFSYFQTGPGYDHVKPAMFAYALDRLGGRSATFERDIHGLFIDEFDSTLRDLAAANGFEIQPEFAETHSRYVLDQPVPVAQVPEGFDLQSLAEENDIEKINAVLWRGFDHEGAPPASEIPGRRRSQSAPSFRKDLTIVAVAPSGDYASYAGMWLVPENRVAYVEPVATDPDYRRMGLGRAVVLETVRRAAELGADVAWVGSGQQFYLDIGFTPMFKTDLWVRNIER